MPVEVTLSEAPQAPSRRVFTGTRKLIIER
jgi:hypothetical protein